MLLGFPVLLDPAVWEPLCHDLFGMLADISAVITDDGSGTLPSITVLPRLEMYFSSKRAAPKDAPPGAGVAQGPVSDVKMEDVTDVRYTAESLEILANGELLRVASVVLQLLYRIVACTGVVQMVAMIADGSESSSNAWSTERVSLEEAMQLLAEFLVVNDADGRVGGWQGLSRRCFCPSYCCTLVFW